MGGRDRHEAERQEADLYGGVLSRDLLAMLGVDDRAIRTEIRAGRWRAHGRQTIALHTGDLTDEALRWRAVWEVGSGIAALDGVTALQAAGLTGYVDDRVHVSTRHHHNTEQVGGVVVHKLIRRPVVDVVPVGIPRVRPAVAAIHAAHWATSDRQAALILCMGVQQRLLTGRQLLSARRRTKGRTRRRFIDRIVRDIALGAESLGELDLADACRARGLPEPERQVVRRGPKGKIYLDVRWDNGLVVEVDGSAHRQGLSVADDNLRSNAVTLSEDVVLRIDLVGWRLFREAFLDQVCAGHSLCEARGTRGSMYSAS